MTQTRMHITGSAAARPGGIVSRVRSRDVGPKPVAHSIGALPAPSSCCCSIPPSSTWRSRRSRRAWPQCPRSMDPRQLHLGLCRAHPIVRTTGRRLWSEAAVHCRHGDLHARLGSVCRVDAAWASDRHRAGRGFDRRPRAARGRRGDDDAADALAHRPLPFHRTSAARQWAPGAASWPSARSLDRSPAGGW